MAGGSHRPTIMKLRLIWSLYLEIEGHRRPFSSTMWRANMLNQGEHLKALMSAALISGYSEYRPEASQTARDNGPVPSQQPRCWSLSLPLSFPLCLLLVWGRLETDKCVTESTTQRPKRHGQPMSVGWIAESRPDQQPRCVKRPFRSENLAPTCIQNRPHA